MSLWNALLTCIVKHNAKVMQVSQAEVVCRQLAEEEKYSTRLDVLSGFSLSDRKRRILLVEGLHPDVHEMLFFARKLFNPADNAKRFLLRRGTTRHLNKLRIRRESVAVAPDEDMAALFRSPQSGAGSSPGGGDQSSGLTSPMSSGFSPPHGMSALAPEDRPQLAEKNRGGVRQLLGLLRESQRSSDSPPARIFFHDNLRYFRRQYADFDLFPKPISLRVSVEEALLRPSLYECKTKADCSAVVTLEKILSIDRLKHGAHLLKAMNLFPNAVDLVRLEALYGDGSVSKGYVPPTDAGVQKKKGATETENTSAAVVGERKVAIGLPGSVGEVLQVVRFEDGTKGGGKGAGSRRPRSAGSENGSPHLQGKKPTSAERKRRDGSPRLQQQSHTWNLTFLKTLAKRKDRQEFVRKKSPKKAESFLNQIAASLLQGSSQGDSNVQLTSTSTANTSATAAMKKMSTVVPDAEQDGRNSPKNGLSRGASTMGNKNGVSRGATGDLAAKDMTDGGGGKSFARTGVTNFAAKLWSKAKSGTAMLSGRNERTPLALNATDKENLLNKSASFAPVSSALAEKMKKMAQMKRAASGLAVETNMVDVVSKRNSPLASAKKSSPTSPQQSPRGAAQIQLMNQRRDIAAPRQTTPETEPATDGLGGNLASALGQLVGGPSSPTGRDKKKRGSVLASPFGADEPMGLGRSGSPRSGMAPLSASDLSFDETDAVVSMQARRKTRITAADFGRLLASSSKKKRDSGGNENIGFGGGGGLGGQREDIGSIQGSHKPGSLGSSHASDIVGAAQLLSFGKPAKGPQIQFKQFSIENVRKQPRTPRNNAPMKEHYKRMPVLLHTTPKARQVAKQLKSLFKDR
ncbi:unnamed protein product [Amoebophrya sp. A25]|nr:unnamed protein product [Amoebophrya sp. A25]|eukprot:GSA25T00012535001.1